VKRCRDDLRAIALGMQPIDAACTFRNERGVLRESPQVRRLRTRAAAPLPGG
jgi:hypothetical protein